MQLHVTTYKQTRPQEERAQPSFWLHIFSVAPSNFSGARYMHLTWFLGRRYAAKRPNWLWHPGVATSILKYSMMKIKQGKFLALAHSKTK
jgi:hypothetical protein